jgi:hypothetical protein
MIRPEFRSRVLGALLIEVENGDLCAVLREETGGREPDSARAGRTGNDGSLAFQQHRFLHDEFRFLIVVIVGGSMNRVEISDKRIVYTTY